MAPAVDHQHADQPVAAGCVGNGVGPWRHPVIGVLLHGGQNRAPRGAYSGETESRVAGSTMGYLVEDDRVSIRIVGRPLRKARSEVRVDCGRHFPQGVAAMAGLEGRLAIGLRSVRWGMGTS